MLPLIAIGGVIGAVMSLAKGASWLSDQLEQPTGASAGGKVDTTAASDASASAFEAALTAQSAGSPVPAGPSASATPATTTVAATQTHGTDYASLARMHAGLFAYSYIGERQNGQDDHGKQSDAPVTGS